jgi:Di-haem oxidoreductase, putative peroxidase
MKKVAAILFWATSLILAQSPFHPEIPKTWDKAALTTLEVPNPEPRFSPAAVPVEYYYRVPVRPIYKTYPVYAPGKEPPHYFEWLQEQEPQVVFEPERLHSEDDWTRAGELVFDAPFGFDFVFTVADVRSAAWFEHVQPPITKGGVMPFATYVIRQKGKIELGTFACAMCHTRVLPDGMIVKGAQGNFSIDRANAFGFRNAPVQVVRSIYRTLTGAPWLNPDPADQANTLSAEEIAAQFDASPPGVVIRHRSSMNYPVAIPDLIGVKNRRYFDRTGLVQHRGSGDLMRYAALNNEMDFLSKFGDFIPRGQNYQTLPDPSTQLRYSDEQLYALSLYLYALKPPANPNRPSALTFRGEKIFNENCAVCHTPPLYTNNKLVPAPGFNVPDDHKENYDVMPMGIGTDPGLTLHTRRGTGYYKVPSLLGVWYRGPFEHDGSVATLEDWLDPKRLSPEYIPTGFRGYGMKTRAVKGHEFGLNLSADDKRALIAFLRTL